MTALGTTGLPLFTRNAPTPPSVPCPTSEAAAQAVEATGKAARQREKILRYLRFRDDGATTQEVVDATGIPSDAARPRLLELAHGIGDQPGLGLIRRTEATRVVPGHRSSLIWRAV